MKYRENITQEELKTLLSYNPDTGKFTWIKPTSNRVKKGFVSDSAVSKGYILIGVKGTRYKAHRLAWLYMTGKYPESDIDHINLNRSDNRWCNLREATRSQNNCNSVVRRVSRTGVKGVTKHNNGYVAHTTLNKKSIYIGYYTNLHEAGLAFQKFAKENHGKFYRELA